MEYGLPINDTAPRSPCVPPHRRIGVLTFFGPQIALAIGFEILPISRVWHCRLPNPIPKLPLCSDYNVAVWFQQQGVTVFLYDNRCIGASDGEPRNDVKPTKLVEDLHDALTFMARHPMVDEDKITLYGYSFMALVAASLDHRVGAVISVTTENMISSSIASRMVFSSFVSSL
ncbi:hypothetical protein BDV29DRAFT_159667 [Aspergillus leporis]|uniref:Alpha/Beta hydrolase protein n=1 Tax=Aspergillus leporis TaxID=41062 RepID=A0A5N5WRU8_9EURO|nr:hypothetical protein BDV29DRAFT_159667 [Aspergillus leporis]